MNILAFLKPKNEVIYLYDDYTVHESLELMEKNRFTTIPVISREGQYVGTLSEGDLLWYIKNTHDFKFDCTKDCVVSAVKRLRDYQAINVNGNMTELIGKAADENFVPVVDDSDLFIGIVTRKTLLNYFFEHKFIVL